MAQPRQGDVFERAAKFNQKVCSQRTCNHNSKSGCPRHILGSPNFDTT